MSELYILPIACRNKKNFFSSKIGMIDDGSELFGTKSGDGFADLALYDDNQDGVIDENDAVFRQLKLTSFGPNGQFTMEPIANREVGAIFLTNILTLLGLESEPGRTDAIIKKTGLFLTEDRKGHLIQHLDYLV